MIEKTACQQCGQEIEFDAGMAGTTAICAGCGGQVPLKFKSTGYARIREQEKAAAKSWIAMVILAVSFLSAGLVAWYVLTHEDASDGVISIVEAIGGLILYWVPAIIAIRRQKKNREAIFFLNLLLGWTGLGWIAAFIWAVTKD